MQKTSKQVKPEKEVVESDGQDIQRTFEFFNANGNERINAKEIKMAMQNIGYDDKNPTVYQIVSELDTPFNSKNGGATFSDFCQTVNNRLPEKETKEELRKVFNLFLDDPNSETTTIESIKRVADELGEHFEEAELNAMLLKASKSGPNLTFDDFYAIMTGAERF